MTAQDTRAGDRGDAQNFDRFLDQHREIAEQVRKDPSLLDNRDFVQNHPALQSYLHDNPGVRDQLRQDPTVFMRQVDSENRDLTSRDRDAAGEDRDPGRRDAVNRDADRRDVTNFNRFLDDHREISEQVRKDPSLLDDRKFVNDHPALQAYLQGNPGVRDQLRQDPNVFMRQADSENRDRNFDNRDAMHDHMADFAGFLGTHSEIQKDVSRDPSVVKDHRYVENHAELNAYLNAHSDVRNDLMADPQNFVHGAQQFNNGTTPGAPGGAGVNTRGSGATGSPAGTSTNPAATPHVSKPNQ